MAKKTDPADDQITRTSDDQINPTNENTTDPVSPESTADFPSADAVLLSPEVSRHAPDHPDVPAELRSLVDGTYGPEYAIISAGKRIAYIENAHRGFDIDVATGERA